MVGSGTRKGAGAEPGAVGSPLATLALRGPIGVQRGPTVRRWTGNRAMRIGRLAVSDQQQRLSLVRLSSRDEE